MKKKNAAAVVIAAVPRVCVNAVRIANATIIANAARNANVKNKGNKKSPKYGRFFIG